jgi:hypothetical protein
MSPKDGDAGLLLRQAWGLSVDVLVTKGLSRNTIEALHSRGLVNVEDLKDIDSAGIASMPLDQHEKAALRQIAEEVTEEAARARGEVPVKNTFIHFNQRPASLDIAMDQKPVAQSCPPALAVPVNLPPGVPSLGSVHHAGGECLPCAWHHGPNGCWHGTTCIFCHICPSGEIKRRKKIKRKLMRDVVPSSPNATPPGAHLAAQPMPLLPAHAQHNGMHPGYPGMMPQPPPVQAGYSNPFGYVANLASSFLGGAPKR